MPQWGLTDDRKITPPTSMPIAGAGARPYNQGTKIKDEEIMLKAAREKKLVTYKGIFQY